MKKKTILSLLCILVLLAVIFLPRDLTDRDAVVSVYSRSAGLFRRAAESGDFERLARLFGVKSVTVVKAGEETEADILCGSRGALRYGILYSRSLDPAASPGVWAAEGPGYRMKDPAGGGETYCEPLGNGYFYYEKKD